MQGIMSNFVLYKLLLYLWLCTTPSLFHFWRNYNICIFQIIFQLRFFMLLLLSYLEYLKISFKKQVKFCICDQNMISGKSEINILSLYTYMKNDIFCSFSNSSCFFDFLDGLLLHPLTIQCTKSPPRVLVAYTCNLDRSIHLWCF